MAIRRRKNQRKRKFGIAAAAAAAAGAVAAFLRARSGSGDGASDDRIDPTAATSPPAPAPVAEDTTSGHSEDAAEAPAPTRPATAAPPEPGEALATPEHEPPGDAVMPDDSSGDPLVDEETSKAAAQAGSIGGNVQAMADSEPGFPEDPATRPVIEGAGDAEETFEATDAELGGNRERRP